MKPKDIPLEHQELMVKIGKRLRDLRKTKGLTYIEFAEQIGISRNGYNNLELGISNFQFITLVTVLKYYEMSVSEFFKDL